MSSPIYSDLQETSEKTVVCQYALVFIINKDEFIPLNVKYAYSDIIFFNVYIVAILLNDDNVSVVITKVL